MLKRHISAFFRFRLQRLCWIGGFLFRHPKKVLPSLVVPSVVFTQ